MTAAAFFQKTTLEGRDVQGPAIAYAKTRGWFIEAIQSKSRKGFPDTFAARHGYVTLVEFKRPGEVPNEQQMKRHAELRAAGVQVEWFDNLAQAKAFFK